jgi:hypothetical protein
MRAIISSVALAAASLLESPAQAGQTSVCEDQRGYTYNTPGRCRSGDRRLDFYRTIRANKHPDDCQNGCVISRFRKGALVVEAGGLSEQCFVLFQIDAPWQLMADFVLDENTQTVGILLSNFGTPLGTPDAREFVFFAVSDDSSPVVVSYRLTDLIGTASADRCHFEATARRRIHR